MTKPKVGDLNGQDAISVELTGENEFHCFRLTFHVRQSPDSDDRLPVEIMLHTRSAFDLFHKLGTALMDYFSDRSSYLLSKLGSERD